MMNNYKRLIKARKGLEKWVNKTGRILIKAQKYFNMRILIKAQKYCDMRDRKFKEYTQILQEMTKNG